MSKNTNNTIVVIETNAAGDPLYQLGNDGYIYILEASRQPNIEYLSLFISIPPIDGYPTDYVSPYLNNVALPQLTVIVGDSQAYRVVEATDVLDEIPYSISAMPFPRQS